MAVHIYEHNNRSYLDSFLKLKRIVNKFELKASVNLKGINNQTTTLFSIQLDGCKYLRGGYKGKILNLFLSTIQKYSSSKVLCPLKADWNYTLSNWNFDENEIPAFLPDSDITGLLEFLIRQRKIISLILYARMSHN
ncbi:uncharacterized protein LOC115482926 [Drosophila hydei]|uniref:Uncharacterized protein LOC115482926 n=1 Tax=Drosophila hydei TaxID=7224 RepID=A0A6J2SS79_DROHY|nr:uncharacterized protein LOC115482926 [Drosophila hydei]